MFVCCRRAWRTLSFPIHVIVMFLDLRKSGSIISFLLWVTKHWTTKELCINMWENPVHTRKAGMALYTTRQQWCSAKEPYDDVPKDDIKPKISSKVDFPENLHPGRIFFFSKLWVFACDWNVWKNMLTCARTRPRSQLASGGLVPPPVPPIKGLRFDFFPPLCSESTPVFPPSGF